jgi:hypothetical protein
VERHHPIEGIKPHIGVDHVESVGGIAAVDLDAGDGQMPFGRAGRQVEAAPCLGKGLVVLPIKKESDSEGEVGLRICLVHRHCPLRDLKSGC